MSYFFLKHTVYFRLHWHDDDDDDNNNSSEDIVSITRFTALSHIHVKLLIFGHFCAVEHFLTTAHRFHL